MSNELQHGWWKTFIFHAVSKVERCIRAGGGVSFDPSSIKNFLFLQYDKPLGSIVHATPLYEAIKRDIPGAYISVAASTMSASVLKNNPFVDRCEVTADPWEKFQHALRDVRRLCRELPLGDVCIVTTLGNQRSRLALLAMLVGRAYRVGFNLAWPLYDAPLLPDWDRPQIESNLDILRGIGYAADAPEPRVAFDTDDVEYAAALLRDTDASCRRIVFVTQTSRGERKQWRVEVFREAIIGILAQTGADNRSIPVFVGSASESEDIDALRTGLPDPGISVAGKTSIPQLAALLAQSDLLVGLDTGTFHVARSVRLPAVVIAPAWQDPREWLPIGNPRYRILIGKPIVGIPADYFIDEISVDQVVDAACDLIARYPPSVDARSERLTMSLRPER